MRRRLSNALVTVEREWNSFLVAFVSEVEHDKISSRSIRCKVSPTVMQLDDIVDSVRLKSWKERILMPTKGESFQHDVILSIVVSCQQTPSNQFNDHDMCRPVTAWPKTHLSTSDTYTYPGPISNYDMQADALRSLPTDPPMPFVFSRVTVPAHKQSDFDQSAALKTRRE